MHRNCVSSKTKHILLFQIYNSLKKRWFSHHNKIRACRILHHRWEYNLPQFSLLKNRIWQPWLAFTQIPVPQKNFTLVASVWNPMMTTSTRPSSWHVTTPSALTALPNFHKGDFTKPSSNALPAGQTHISHQMEWMAYKPISTSQVFKSSPRKQKLEELL